MNKKYSILIFINRSNKFIVMITEHTCVGLLDPICIFFIDLENKNNFNNFNLNFYNKLLKDQWKSF